MLELRGVSKRFDSVEALRSVSLRIEAGEFFSILGPSGCGKTTLLRLLGGFETPTEGEIHHSSRLGSRRIDGLPPEQRPFNLIFQRYALFPHLDVRGNIAFGPRMKGVAADEIARRVERMLALVRMEGMGDRRIQTLSGGQQQRVAIARALANEPEVLLLDEPLSALDLKLREQMRVELRALQRKLGLTFILVTHDQDEALALSDRVAVMNQGVVEQVATPREVYERPATLFVARFIGSINPVDGGWVRPERLGLSLDRPRGEGERFLEATVQQVEFQGATTQIVLERPGAEPLLVTRPSQDPQARLAPGARVYLSWKTEDLICVPR